MNDIELNEKEKEAIKSLEKLAKKWPKTLLLFAGTGLTVRKIQPDGTYLKESIVADIPGIPNDGGDSD